jgi:peptidoglycan/LPS O-acetylase OafA/YrhL
MLKKNSFNLLRLIAATAVIFAHSQTLIGQTGFRIMGSDMGTWGVNTFFVISGFLLSGTRNFDWRYFWRRFLRIFPGLCVVILLSAFIIGPLVTTLSLYEYFNNPLTWKYLRPITIFKASSSLPGVFTNNPFPNVINGSLWMITILLIMYIILFIYGKFVFFKKKRYIILISYVAVGLLVLIKPTIPLPVFIPKITGVSADWFLSLFSNFCRLYLYYFAGVLLALYKHVFKLDWRALIPLFFITVVAYLLNINEAMYIIFPYTVIVIALIENDKLNSLGAKRDISYGLFIYAFPIQQTIVHYIPRISFLGMFLLSAIITALLATLSWKYVENPAQKLKDIDFYSYYRKVFALFKL